MKVTLSFASRTVLQLMLSKLEHQKGDLIRRSTHLSRSIKLRTLQDDIKAAGVEGQTSWYELANHSADFEVETGDWEWARDILNSTDWGAIPPALAEQVYDLQELMLATK